MMNERADILSICIRTFVYLHDCNGDLYDPVGARSICRASIADGKCFTFVYTIH